MKIKTKLISVYLIGAVLTVLTIVFVLMSYASINEDFSIVINQPVKKLEALRKIERFSFSLLASTSELGLLNSEEYRLSHREKFHQKKEIEENEEGRNDGEISEGADEIKGEKDEITDSINNFKFSLTEYESLLTVATLEERQNIKALNENGNELIAECINFVKLVDDKAESEEILEKKEKLENIEDRIIKTIETSYSLQHNELKNKQEHVGETINNSTLRTILLSLIALTFAVVSGYFLSQSVSKSINKLKIASNRIGNGDLDVRIDVNSNDEIGELAKDFEKMTHQLKDSRESIIKNNDFVENIFSSMADMVITVDDFGIIEKVNDSTLINLGYKKEEFIGKEVKILTQKETFLTEDELEFMLGEGKLVEVEKEFVNKNGMKITVLISTSLLKGKQEAAVIVAKDVTKLKKDEQQLRDFARKLEGSNRELQDFAYVASHDLQEPLRKIQAFGERLNKKYAENLGVEGNDYIRRMQDAATRMQTLIEGLLEYSRVSTKVQPFVRTDLKQICEEVVSDLEIRIEKTKAEVIISELPGVEADALQMRQLFQNLISNALKFQPQGTSPIVKIYAETVSEENLCRIYVEDNGIGFDEKYLDRIFGVFQRLHGRSEYEGSGIGLSVCKKIVERHGGEITAKSEAGKGATFIITFPLKIEHSIHNTFIPPISAEFSLRNIQSP